MKFKHMEENPKRGKSGSCDMKLRKGKAGNWHFALYFSF